MPKTAYLGSRASIGAGVRHRFFVEGIGERDRALGDFLPVRGVELVEPPRSGSAADDPDEHQNGESQLHALDPPSIRGGNHVSEAKSKQTLTKVRRLPSPDAGPKGA